MTDTVIESQTDQILLPRWLVLPALLIILCCAAFVRWRLLDFPLERDEGEYAYAGQLMLQGIPPYKLAYNMKLPGTYAVYALIMAVFGQTIRGIHIGLILVNSITILLVYFLGRRLFGQICGIVAAASFALLSLSTSVYGLAAHATHFVTMLAVAGTLVLLKSTEKGRPVSFFWCGLLFGVAFLMKQPGVFFALFGGLFLLWNEVRRRPINWTISIQRLGLYCAGVALPLAATCIYLSTAGVFGRFWFWTVSYAREYVTRKSLPDGWIMFKGTISGILHAAPGIWLLAVIGAALALLAAERRRVVLFTLAFAAASFATSCPGLYFREHYFIPLLPAVGLFVGAGIQIISEEIASGRYKKFWLALPIAVFLAAFAQAAFRHRALFFTLSPIEAARASYEVNPFPESIEIGRYIQEHSQPNDRIAVIGSEPEIYFYTRRHSATGYIYTYGLMEPQKYALAMQQEMIAEIEAAKPEFVVFVHVYGSWLPRKDSHQLILDWGENYTRRSMRQVGLVDIRSMQQTVYRWDENAVSAIPRSESYVTIFKRNDLF